MSNSGQYGPGHTSPDPPGNLHADVYCPRCPTGGRPTPKGPIQSWGNRYTCADCFAEFDVALAGIPATDQVRTQGHPNA